MSMTCVHYVCNSLVIGETTDSSEYGDASQLPILMDNVKCSGTELNILSCPQKAINDTHDCLHSEDVAIVCRGKESTHSQ